MLPQFAAAFAVGVALVLGVISHGRCLGVCVEDGYLNASAKSAARPVSLR